MPSEPISALTNGNPAQSGDLLPIARSGLNFGVTAASIAALGAGFSTSGVGGFWSAGFPLSIPYLTTFNGAPIGVTNDLITVFQFTLTSSWTIRTVNVDVTGGATGGTANFGIYTAAGAKQVDSGAITATSASGNVTMTITPVVLPPGTYYFAQSAHATSGVSAITVIALTQSGQTVPIALMNSVGSMKVGTAANPTSSGVMPATLGVITPGSTLAMSGVFFGV